MLHQEAFDCALVSAQFLHTITYELNKSMYELNKSML